MHTSQLIKPGYVEQVVYYDSSSVYTGLTSGTSAKPVNNETDMRAICIARSIKTVVLRGTATILKFTSTLSDMNFEGEGVGGLTPTVDFNGQAIGCTFNNLEITDTTGSNLVSVSEFTNCLIMKVIAHTVDYSNYHKCKFVSPATNPAGGKINCYDNCIWLGHLCNTTGEVYIYGDCLINGYLENGAGAIYIYGNCSIGGYHSNTAGTVSIRGNCLVVSYLENTAGTIYIYGNCSIGDYLDNLTTGVICIYGNCSIVGNLGNATGAIELHGDCSIGNYFRNESTIRYCTIKSAAPSTTLDCTLSATSVTERVVSRGNLTVAKMVAGATAIIDLCGGTLTTAASCTGGTIDLYGDCAYVDLAGAAVTINDHRVPGHL